MAVIMRSLKILMLFLIVNFCSKTTIAQSKKKIRKYQIREITEQSNLKSSNHTETYNETKSKFDVNGFLIEKLDYKKDGQIKTRQVNKYDKNGFLLEEIEYDGFNQLKKKKKYTYNFEGEKLVENEYDKTDQLFRKTINKYDARGFRIEKQVYDQQGNLLHVKKYIYDK
jgi:hypothetical protein